MRHVRSSNKVEHQGVQDFRLRAVGILFTVAFLIVGFRLIVLMVLHHGFYTALASGSHEIYAQLFPERGSIYLESQDTDERFPLAINRDLFLMFADTRKIDNDEMAEDIAEKLAEIFEYDDDKKFEIFLQLKKPDDPYEPLEKKVEESIVEKIRDLELPGILFTRRSHRFYPEGNLAAQIVGFLGKDTEGNDIGSYGLEGYWNKDLSGSGGFLEGTRSAKGSWIPLAGRLFEPAQDGVDLTLTIDRTLQFKACEILKRRQEEYNAQSASLVILDPSTGAIKAMCSLPDFDPNKYNEAESNSVYNNLNIFTPYEPGSIFKPVAMAAALNEDLIQPDTYFYDSGSVDVGCYKPIKNANFEAYGDQTMTGVLENSINTGMVHVVKLLGKELFRSYVEKFGFAVKTGIELNTEASGTTESLYRNSGDNVDCYTATGSFGQGLTATPLQLVSAFGAIANGGTLMKPYIIKKTEYADGKIEETKPREIRKVLEKRSSSFLASMLVRVIDTGTASLAKVPGYYVAGKTGTAQIPGPGGYTDETNHSFVGFGPVDDPKFVMIVKFEKPHRSFSSLTAAPTFAEVAQYIMQYYRIPPDR
ncbi:penicillin-binding protein 2 [Candidatus Parcubacteria bacterium]|jgi:cell division protein FtsI/penicillin-binding protein 2|nr:penicillin-binding protein 2 [Candidatus Parcubacteria bacterium]MBT3948935.1 penicillin-binding protein 2 [Candidatus Parcubacteria bacterium]